MIAGFHLFPVQETILLGMVDPPPPALSSAANGTRPGMPISTPRAGRKPTTRRNRNIKGPAHINADLKQGCDWIPIHSDQGPHTVRRHSRLFYLRLPARPSSARVF